MILLDVGAHDGQTLAEVTKPHYNFSRIASFEPMPTQYVHLVSVYGNLPGVEIHNFGLADQTGELPLYGSNDIMEASLFASKNDVDASVITMCQFVRATEFLESLPEGEPLIIKLNCEGGEVPILHDLIASGAIWRAHNIMIDWDVRKIVGMEHEEGNLLYLLAEIGFTRYSLCDDVMVGSTHQDRIANWLRGVL